MSELTRFCEITVTVPVGDTDKPYGWTAGNEFDRLMDALQAVAGLHWPEADVGGYFYVQDGEGRVVSNPNQSGDEG